MSELTGNNYPKSASDYLIVPNNVMTSFLNSRWDQIYKYWVNTKNIKASDTNEHCYKTDAPYNGSKYCLFYGSLKQSVNEFYAYTDLFGRGKDSSKIKCYHTYGTSVTMPYHSSVGSGTVPIQVKLATSNKTYANTALMIYDMYRDTTTGIVDSLHKEKGTTYKWWIGVYATEMWYVGYGTESKEKCILYIDSDNFMQFYYPDEADLANYNCFRIAMDSMDESYKTKYITIHNDAITCFKDNSKIKDTNYSTIAYRTEDYSAATGIGDDKNEKESAITEANLRDFLESDKSDLNSTINITSALLDDTFSKYESAMKKHDYYQDHDAHPDSVAYPIARIVLDTSVYAGKPNGVDKAAYATVYSSAADTAIGGLGSNNGKTCDWFNVRLSDNVKYKGDDNVERTGSGSVYKLKRRQSDGTVKGYDIGSSIYSTLPVYGFTKDTKGKWYAAFAVGNTGNKYNLFDWLPIDSNIVKNIYPITTDNRDGMFKDGSAPTIDVLVEPETEDTATPFDMARLDGTEESFMQNYFSNSNYEEQIAYYKSLGGWYTDFSMKSFNSIIGLPFNFMKNVDPCIGSSPYGKQFIEDILYDMPIVLLRPGGPSMNSSIDANGSSSSGIVGLVKEAASYYNIYFKNATSLKDALLGDDGAFLWYTNSEGDGSSNTGILEALFLNIFVGKYSRFYTFNQDFSMYTQYVNTLCHLFISFLGIGNLYYSDGNGNIRNYAYYNDTWEQGMETDSGKTLRNLYGPNHAVYGYYQPESNISQVYTNSTGPSTLADTLTGASDIAKEAAFFMTSNGINKAAVKLDGVMEAVAGNSHLLGRLFGNIAEGAATILAGNNLDLPEIWRGSEAQTSHTIVFKLSSPYGDRESIFLYVLRPLARLLAMSLPRQFGPNSYTSPFLVQAFSKGQFNIQCGIVTSLSVRRCGNGGESHTIMNIPTELEVTMEIQDMYELVTLSNEFVGLDSDWQGWLDPILNIGSAKFNVFGSARAARLLFNNIGLMDFCAAYCGMNMNMPEQDMMITLLHDIYVNRVADTVGESILGIHNYKNPSWTRQLHDAAMDAAAKQQTFITG